MDRRTLGCRARPSRGGVTSTTMQLDVMFSSLVSRIPADGRVANITCKRCSGEQHAFQCACQCAQPVQPVPLRPRAGATKRLGEAYPARLEHHARPLLAASARRVRSKCETPTKTNVNNGGSVGGNPSGHLMASFHAHPVVH
jgi:hypothetical protein